MTDNIKDTSAKILAYLQGKEKVSSWELKLRLHLAGSMLYISLGSLLEQGKIEVEQHGLDYNIKLK
ncbi:hypothetical protein Emin_0416 [Elusimicrobium minutum Pei191]|uniref:Uncharacterized protein n=1 Tax=Elusimicrobium minutum (strain Pei191) TaxID=445932 RepID=B2KBF1_ELUMP|nr:hypothetical protein [Elusimicrobium minutum]ACC97973.1 hypothetical protein Emin_0416 [Elusimicrobium minutum Pei191]